MPLQNLGFASGEVVARREVAGMTPLLEEFLDHAQRNPKALSNFVASAFASVVGGQNPFPKIQG